MKYFGETKKLSDALSDDKTLRRLYGAQLAKQIRFRLIEFGLAKSLADISHLPPACLEKLKGNKQDQFSVRISPNWRMVFEAYTESGEQTVNKGLAVKLSIIKIEDYH